MSRFRTAAMFLWAPAALTVFAALCGCESSSPTRAAVDTPPAPVPQIVRQGSGEELMRIDAARVPGVALGQVREAELPAVLEANGQVTFDDRSVSSIVSRVAGRIEQVRVSQWDNVRRGEAILALYSPDFMTAEAEYLQAKQTARLSGAPGITGMAGMAASMEDAAERKLELLGMEPADIRAIVAPSPTVWMRAPIGGTVIENKATRGAAVNPGDVLYTVGTLNDVWITASIYEDDLARVHEGQSLEAVVTAYPNDVFKGVISRVSPGIDPATYTAQIRCTVANPGLKLKPQMLARVRIVTRPGMALVIAQQALVFDTDSYFAYVRVGPDTVARRKVVIASWNEKGYARIVSGLAAGDTVVVAGSLQVDELWREAHGQG
ncbi:MAG TPA: efflux RND transporter periplasmic adaptor subunit [Candidatus Binataceae bacterium]|nr:efflux RND transporter periplasmic adaptor subunit [Candidatus Binataceae bacterium]